jgi:hypothetical protein
MLAKIKWEVLFAYLGCLAVCAGFWFVVWSWAASSLRAALGVMP